eukprot:TRINITY_DN1413_c4_g1_i2.p1 TRINITY_DN1413_c4_g1~~TRINITY_DN1413_c4_g1_i2.p1  ORF type:complete len:656 (+),score=106.86 TRINITY_DN1413_c4_g1_i2:47-2014(+)
MQWSLNDQSNVSATIGGGLVDKLRQQVHCKFCGGKTCRHEDWKRALDVKNTHIAFEGLHSNWVENWAVASQRLATSLIEEFDLIGQFKAANLKAIFNLQEAGEHPFCGPEGTLHPESGFSYVPERDLMPHGIYCYNFPWPDMGTPSNDIVLRTVQLMCDHVSKGEKFLVHCHAGLGRTGLMIACWMMYHSKTSADETIRRIRFQRPGSIQTAKQQQFVSDFSSYLKKMRTYFFEPSVPQTLTQILERQSSYLHGHEARALRYVPKVCHVVLTTILSYVDNGVDSSVFTGPLFSLASSSPPKIPTSIQDKLTSLQEAVNNDDWSSVKNADQMLLIPLLVTFLTSLKAPILSEENLVSLRESSTSGHNYIKSHRSLPLPQSDCSPLSPPSCGTRSFSSSVAVRLNSRRRVLPPLGCSDGRNPENPIFITTANAAIAEADDELVAPMTQSDQKNEKGNYPGRDLLIETADRLRAESSSAIKGTVTKAAYHTTAILLSLLRLITSDHDDITVSRTVASGVALLSIQSVSKIASDPKLVGIFHSATSEWGASYFSNKQTVLSPISESNKTVTYESWVAELSGATFRNSGATLATPPTLTLSAPEGGGEVSDTELMSISVSDSVNDKSSRMALSPHPSKGLAVLSVGDSEFTSPVASPRED